MKRRQAFTLIELMVAMAILGIVTTFLTDMLTRQSKTYTVVDQVAETQQNLRALANLMERELRHTGFMVPEAAGVCGLDRTNASDVLFLSDGDALDPTNENQLDVGASISAGYGGTGASETLTLDNVVIDAVPFYDTDGNGVADSDFLQSLTPARRGGVMVVDRANPDRGVSCGVVTDVSGNSITVDFTLANMVAAGPVVAPTPNPAGSPLAAWLPSMNIADLVAVPAHFYAVVGTQLVRDGMVLAQDVEDLQFALFYDTNDNGLTDAGENPGALGEAVYSTTAWDSSDLTEVRVNVVARTRAQDPDVLGNPGNAQGQFQPTENRVAPVLPNDGFRRRLHSATVRPRNVGARSVGG